MVNDFRLIQRPELQLELITIYEISRIIDKNSPFRGKHAKESDIHDYLERMNNALYRKNADLDELKHHYITTASIYIFLKHLLNLTTIDDTERNFKTIIAKAPYELENPFDVYYKKASEEEPEYLEHNDLKYTPQSEDMDNLKLKRSDSYIRKIERDMFETAQLLKSAYHTRLHFTLLGYTNVAVPLFGINMRDKFEIRLVEHQMENRHGTFLIQLPDYFSVPEKEAI